MKSICKKVNSNLVFVNMPTSTFTGHKVIRMANDSISLYFENNNRIDSIYSSIASLNKLAYIEMTKHFLSLEKKSNYFFKFDVHPNEKGYNEMDEYIGKELIKENIIK